jgi:hypothetical protein
MLHIIVAAPSMSGGLSVRGVHQPKTHLATCVRLELALTKVMMTRLSAPNRPYSITSMERTMYICQSCTQRFRLY